MENADETPFYPEPRQMDENLLGDLTGGRPGAIIETAEQLEIKDKVVKEMESGKRDYPKWFYSDYGELKELAEADYDIDDPDAIDMNTLGTWTIFDLESEFDYEWHPNKSERPDPNKAALQDDDSRYLASNPVDEDGIEVGFTAVFGPSNPIDQRTILGTKDSYMVDERYRDDSRLTPLFPDGDPEIDANTDVVQFRQSLALLETYIDPFLPATMEVPRHVAKWHGYPDQVFLEPHNFTNNRFTTDADRTDFDALTPFRARQRAVELARAKNAEWLPDGVSQAWHQSQRQPYDNYRTLMGTLKKGDCDAALVEKVQPALDVLGSCVDLLSIHDDGAIFRFHYHGLMKNKHGMKCWAEEMIRDCGLGAQLKNVVFETGFRRRDAPYDGGDPYYGPRFH